MEAIENASRCPAAIDQLIESSKTLDNGKSAREDYHLKWIPYSCTDNPYLGCVQYVTTRGLGKYFTN